MTVEILYNVAYNVQFGADVPDASRKVRVVPTFSG
jgi:hypothetical protein